MIVLKSNYVPITDVYGNIIGFSGRTYLEKDVSEPKYINTQETPIFRKMKYYIIYIIVKIY